MLVVAQLDLSHNYQHWATDKEQPLAIFQLEYHIWMLWLNWPAIPSSFVLFLIYFMLCISEYSCLVNTAVQTENYQEEYCMALCK